MRQPPIDFSLVSFDITSLKTNLPLNEVIGEPMTTFTLTRLHQSQITKESNL